MALITDRIGLQLDSLTRDLVMTNGKLVWTTGLDAVVQGVHVRLAFFAGEWFADLDKGTKWYQEILGKKPDSPRIRQEISKQILAAPGVTKLLSLEVTYVGATRQLRVDWQAQTEFGDTPEESTIIS